MGENLQILGVTFHTGSFTDLLRRSEMAGLIVVPSAPVLVQMADDAAHCEAVTQADLAIADSGWMVLLWKILRWQHIPRYSGLRFLEALVETPTFRELRATFWVMPNEEDSIGNRRWLQRAGVAVTEADCWIAPRYGAGELSDDRLLVAIEQRQPRFIVLCLGGGVQERLGYYLRRNLSYRPTILCTGAAIAFLSGRQVNIPTWADRLFLGWLMRCLSRPTVYAPRYWRALRLAALLVRHGRNSPLPPQDYTPAEDPVGESAGASPIRAKLMK